MNGPVRRLVGRLAGVAFTLFCASVAIFTLLDLLPGDAASVLLGTAARPDTVGALKAQLGLDLPAPERYAHWLTAMLRGDFGRSATYGVSVGQLIVERLPVTLPLAGLAFGLAALMGVPLGLLAAARPGRPLDRMATVLAQIGLALPDFWVGLLLILLFSTGLHWFGAGGFPGWRPDPVAACSALLMPAFALAFPQAAVLTRVTRAAALDLSQADFVRTARAKGLRRSRVLWRHLLPNVIVPVVTVLGLQLSFLVAGAVLVENVFALPGLGRLATQSLAQRDLPTLRGIIMVFAALVITVNGLVDLLVLRLDPRMRAP